MGSGKVAVAMSGGVDSSVAAALLCQQGWEVIGITLDLWPRLDPHGAVGREDACCSLSAVEDARRVADALGIPHYVLNFRDLFAEKVIADFVAEYQRGRTPNPCIRCNEHIKFAALLRKAQGLGADYVATGHYARIERRERYLLKKAVDSEKDQSYVLYVLMQEQLAHTLMPLGGYTKAATRKLARELGLRVAAKPESQDICFIPDDYGRFLEKYAPAALRSGPILNRRGEVLGQHRGIAFYTIGQRRGLGVATGQPLYVVALDAQRNAVIVGREGELYASELVADQVNWIAIERLEGSMEVEVKVRYRTPEAPATLRPLEANWVHLHFRQPQRAVTPGQAVVFYQGDTVIGGGRILSPLMRTTEESPHPLRVGAQHDASSEKVALGGN